MSNFNTELTMSLVKSYEDACRELGILPTYPKFTQCQKQDRKSMIAYHQLTVIIRALNILPNGKCWEVDLNERYQIKWRIWWDICKSGLILSCITHMPSYASTQTGSRLLFRSEELAKYCAKQFKDLWSDYILM